MDDHKYFPLADKAEDVEIRYANAAKICRDADLPSNVSLRRILQMISWVSCSENGNNVPLEVSQSGAYHLLIPRWADRLEAVGAIVVVRCYRYNQEKGARHFAVHRHLAPPRPRMCFVLPNRNDSMPTCTAGAGVMT